MISNFDNFKFRCSSLGNIVTASGKLTDGAKTYLEDLFIEQVDGVRREAYGYALDKGVACEIDGIQLFNDVFHRDIFVKKWNEPKENEYIKGTPDVIVGNCVTDIKSAWDRFTFSKAKLSHVYEWQLHGYMMLHDLSEGRLFYCLTNLPDFLIENEEKKLFYTQKKWDNFENSDYKKSCLELRAAHNYDNKQIYEKFKFWDLQRLEANDLRIQESVIQARIYLNTLLKKRNEEIEKNKNIYGK